MIFFRAHDDWIHELRFLSDDRMLLSVGESRAVLWDAETGGQLRCVREKVAAAAVSDGGCAVWKSESGELTMSALPEDRPMGGTVSLPGVRSLAVSRDGTQVALGKCDAGYAQGSSPSEEELRSVGLWRPLDGAVRWLGGHGTRIKEDDVYGDITRRYAICDVALSPDGSAVASGGEDGTARLWDVRSGRELGRFSHDYPVWHVAFAAGDLLIAGKGDYPQEVRVWRQGAPMLKLPGALLAVSRVGDAMAVGEPPSGRVAVLELPSGREVRRLELPRSAKGPAATAAFFAGGKRLAVGTTRGEVLVD